MGISNFQLNIMIHDGKKKRKLEYEDLWIIYWMRLPCVVYKRRRWWELWRGKIDGEIAQKIFVTLSTALSIQGTLPGVWLHCINIAENTNIGYIKCKRLHEQKTNKLVRLMLQQMM